MGFKDQSPLAKDAINAIETILINKGFTLSDKAFADYHFQFYYFMQSFQRTEIVSVVSGESITNYQAHLSGTSSANSSVNLNGQTYGKVNSNFIGSGNIYSRATNTANYNATSTTTHISYVPILVTYYDKAIILKVLDRKNSMKVIWQGDASIIDKHDDLDGSIALEMASLFKHFGKPAKNKTVTETVNGFNKLLKKKKMKQERFKFINAK